MTSKIAIVGSGFIGRAWAISFARGGHPVALWDPAPGAAAAAVGFIDQVLADLEANDLLRGQKPAEVRARLTPVDRLEDALAGAVHVQENAPEVLATKRALFAELDRLAAPGTVLASSSSALVPSSLREGALALGATRGRAVLSVILPAALPGIVTGVLVALARVAGETAPLLFTAFNNRFFSAKLDQPIASLTVQIFTYAISPYEDWHRQAWAAALVLIVMVFAASLSARLATRRGVASR